jgi:hypothetical protein
MRRLVSSPDIVARHYIGIDYRCNCDCSMSFASVAAETAPLKHLLEQRRNSNVREQESHLRSGKRGDR